ncbi:hypothetical protein GIB67_034906, partial [Kingdonia uniflora]
PSSIDFLFYGLFTFTSVSLFTQYLFKIFILSLREKMGKSVATADFTTFGYETTCGKNGKSKIIATNFMGDV